MIFPPKKRMQYNVNNASASGLDLLFQASQLSKTRSMIEYKSRKGDDALHPSGLTCDSNSSPNENSTSNAKPSPNANPNPNSTQNRAESHVKSIADESAAGNQCDGCFKDENEVNMMAHQYVGGNGDADLDGGTVVSLTHSDHDQDSDKNDPEQKHEEQINRVRFAASPSNPTFPSPSSHRYSRTFPQILHHMLTSSSNSEIVSWLPTGDRFVILQPRRFATEILPLYFRKTALESFVRKLNRWGFRRVKIPLPHRFGGDLSVSGSYETTIPGKEVPTISAFEHKYFLRENPRLCAKMFCRSKPGYNVVTSCAEATACQLDEVGSSCGGAAAIKSSSARVSVALNYSPVVASASSDRSEHADRDRQLKEPLFMMDEQPKHKQVRRASEDDGTHTFLAYGISISHMGGKLERVGGYEHSKERVLPQNTDDQGEPKHAGNHPFLESKPFHDFLNQQYVKCHQQQHQRQHNHLLVQQSRMRKRMRMHWQRKRQLQWQLQMQMLGMHEDKFKGNLPVPSSTALHTFSLPTPSSMHMPVSYIQIPVQGHMKSNLFLLPRIQAIGLDVDTTSNHLSLKQDHYPPLFCTTATQKSREYLRKRYLLR